MVKKVHVYVWNIWLTCCVRYFNLLDHLKNFISESRPDQNEAFRGRDEAQAVGLLLDVGVDEAVDPETKFRDGDFLLKNEVKILPKLKKK